MTKYNKAQQECIEQWGEYPEALAGPNCIRQFLDEFNEIDPTPDPPQWFCITYGTSGSNIYKVTKDTREEASAWLTSCLNAVKADEVDSYVSDSFLGLKNRIKYSIMEDL